MSEAVSQDGAPGNGKGQHAEADLPGLSVETGGVRLDERGFERAGALVPWGEVSCVTASGSRVTVEGRRESDGPARVLLAFRAGREDAKRIEAVWRERVLRSLERGEPLGGTIRARALWLPRIFLVLALFAAAVAIGDASVVGRASSQLVRDDPLGPLDLPPLAAMFRAVRVAAWTSLIIAAAGSVAFLVFAVRFRRLLRDWKKWQLTAEGLTYWPSGERKLLRPLAGDVFTPDSARMNERRVPLRWLSASPLVTPLLLAWGRRAQSSIYRDSLAETCLPPAMAAGLLVVALVVRSLAPGEPYWAWASAASGLLVAAWIVLFMTSGRKLRRLLDEGARTLERLGW